MTIHKFHFISVERREYILYIIFFISFHYVRREERGRLWRGRVIFWMIRTIFSCCYVAAGLVEGRWRRRRDKWQRPCRKKFIHYTQQTPCRLRFLLILSCTMLRTLVAGRRTSSSIFHHIFEAIYRRAQQHGSGGAKKDWEIGWESEGEGIFCEIPKCNLRA